MERDVDTCQGQGVAHGDQLPVVLGGLNPRHLGHRQHVSLFHGAVFDMDHSFRCYADLPRRHRPPVGHGFLRHVHHPGAALLVEMGQFSHGSASDLIHGPGRIAGMLCQVVPPRLMQDAP